METPQVSVIINTYNHKDYISQAIESVLMQKTTFAFEIIIGEDDSNDGTREICMAYAEKYKNKIRLFLRSRKDVIYVNGRPTGRRNFIENLKSSKGKYVALLPGDDYWTDPQKLQIQVDFLERNLGYAGAFHETQMLMEDGQLGNIYGKYEKSYLTIEDTLSTKSPFHTSSLVFRNYKFIFPKWFYTIVSADMALFSLVAQFGKLKAFNSIMSIYRQHPGGSTKTTEVKNNLHKNRIELMEYLDEYFHFKYSKEIQKVIYWHTSHLSNHKITQKNKSFLLRVKSFLYKRLAN